MFDSEDGRYVRRFVYRSVMCASIAVIIFMLFTIFTAVYDGMV